MRKDDSMAWVCARCAMVLSVLVPLATAGQRLTPRLVEPSTLGQQTAEMPRSAQLQQRFLDSSDWTFYHRIEDLPAPMSAAFLKGQRSSMVNTGESFDTGDILVYRVSAQHLFSAATDDLWVMVWYSGGFNGPQLMTLLYDPLVHDAYLYGFGKPFGAISLEPELKNLVRFPQPGWTARYYAPDTR